MKYNDLEILKSGYEGIHNHIIPLMLRTEEVKLRNRINKTINPIIWMSWHMLRTEDMFLSNVVFKLDQIFHVENWQNKLGITTANVGTGMGVEEADRLSAEVLLDPLLKYNQSVKQHSLNLLKQVNSLGSDELDPAQMIESRLRKAEAFPEGVLQERAGAYAPTPISTCLLGLINHSYMHFGQYLAIMKPL